ncbi:MAG TPA: twin-arginine translocase TatA/TatE family subunit [Aestuariivirgaceae bacterium]|nr:twin-arginine translocase TatA/TatE family subunit [Aestuariivirgaceae bacterium]
MGTFSIWHWIIVLAVVLVLFGGSGKISSLMGDMAKGIKSFKKGLSDDTEEEKEAAELRTLQHDAEERAAATKAKTKVSS